MSEFYCQKWPHPYLTPSIARTLVGKTPRHAQLQCPYFGPVEQKPSAAMTEGSIVDALVLGGDPGCTVLDFENYRTKEAREIRDASSNPILIADYERCQNAAVRVKKSIKTSSEIAVHALELGRIKKRLFWQSASVHCSTEPDVHCADIVLDLKRTKVAPTVANWERHAYTMRYGLQVAATLEATKAKRFGWLIIEADPPHLSVVHWASDAFIKVARDDWKLAVDTWRNCIECNHFPGYESGIIEPMAWQLGDGDEITFTEDAE